MSNAKVIAGICCHERSCGHQRQQLHMVVPSKHPPRGLGIGVQATLLERKPAAANLFLAFQSSRGGTTENLSVWILFDPKVKTRTGVIICGEIRSLSQPTVVGSPEAAPCTPNEKSICSQVDCGTAPRAWQPVPCHAFVPRALSRPRRPPSAPDTKAPSKDSECNLKARRF